MKTPVKKKAAKAVKRNWDLEKLITAGVMLSNVAFNGKQNQDVPKRYRDALEEGQKAWDKALSEFREVKKKGIKS